MQNEAPPPQKKNNIKIPMPKTNEKKNTHTQKTHKVKRKIVYRTTTREVSIEEKEKKKKKEPHEPDLFSLLWEGGRGTLMMPVGLKLIFKHTLRFPTITTTRSVTMTKMTETRWSSASER